MLQQYLRLLHLEHPSLHLTVLRLLHVEAPDTSTVTDVNDAVTPISCAPTVLKVATPGTSKSPPNCTAPVNVEAPAVVNNSLIRLQFVTGCSSLKVDTPGTSKSPPNCTATC